MTMTVNIAQGASSAGRNSPSSTTKSPAYIRVDVPRADGQMMNVPYTASAVFRAASLPQRLANDEPKALLVNGDLLPR